MRVFCIGDSITFGLGDEENQGWVKRLRRVPDVQYYNLGVPGQTLDQFLARAYHEVTARMVPYHDTLIIIAGSLNDLCQDETGAMRTDPAILEEQLNALIGAMKKLAPVLVLGPPPVDETANPHFVPAMGKDMNFKNAFIAMADEHYADISQKNGAPYLSLYHALLNDDSYRNSLKETDGIHPEYSGYMTIADYINNWMPFRARLPEV